MTARPTRTRTGHTALTPEVQSRICSALVLGTDRKAAAEFAGVRYDALRQWLRRGEQGERPFAAFAAAVEKAEADAIVRMVGHIQGAIEEKRFSCKGTTTVEGKCEMCGEPYRHEKRCRSSITVPGNWTAAAWVLERRYPQRFGRSERVEVTQVLSGEEMVTLMRELAEAVVRSGVSDEQRNLIEAGWMEIARRRGLVESTPEDAARDRETRARYAQRRLIEPT